MTDIITELLLAVSRLGEMELRGWWRTHTFSQAGRYTLGRLFRRTWQATAFEMNILSAMSLHDDILERPTALHLFSDQLPYRRAAGAWLAEVKSGMTTELLEEFGRLELDSVIARIKSLTADTVPPKGKRIAAALRLGTLNPQDLDDDSALESAAKQMAYAYIDQGSDLKPPYFDLTQ